MLYMVKDRVCTVHALFLYKMNIIIRNIAALNMKY